MPQPTQTASLKRLLTSPTRLFARSEVLQKPSPVPPTNGCYAWYFREVPKTVPTRGCLTFEGKTLLYIGVAPDKQYKPDTRQTLRSRIKRHYQGDAKGSTLRRTLGVLLEPQSGFPLRRVGSGNRITLTPAGEGYLNQWMEENAFVVWDAYADFSDRLVFLFESVADGQFPTAAFARRAPRRGYGAARAGASIVWEVG